MVTLSEVLTQNIAVIFYIYVVVNWASYITGCYIANCSAFNQKVPLYPAEYYSVSFFWTVTTCREFMSWPLLPCLKFGALQKRPPRIAPLATNSPQESASYYSCLLVGHSPVLPPVHGNVGWSFPWIFFKVPSCYLDLEINLFEYCTVSFPKHLIKAYPFTHRKFWTNFRQVASRWRNDYHKNLKIGHVQRSQTSDVFRAIL